MTDQVTNYHDLHVTVRMGEAIEVNPVREKSPAGDPIMNKLRSQMLDLMGQEDRWPFQPVEDA